MKQFLTAMFVLVLISCGGTTTTPVKNIPAAPTNFTATATSSNIINLNWTASTGATAYKLERKNGSAAFAQISTPNNTSFSDTGLSANTVYTYRLLASNADGEGSSVETSATTQVVSGGSAPATPTGFVATANSSSAVLLSWNAVSAATAYKLERKIGAGAFSPLASPSSNSYNDTGLSASTAYTYKLVSSNANGDSGPVEASATTITATNPATAEINAYFRGLPSWASTHPLKDEDRLNGSASNDRSAVLPDVTAESGQRRYDCTTTPYSLSKTPDKIVTFSPDSGKLWLGSLLQGDGYTGGLGSLKELPIRERAPLKIFIDLLGAGVTETINNPDAASVQSAIGGLVGRAKTQGTPWGSSFSYDKRETFSSDELALKFGLSVKYLAVDVKTKLDVNRLANEKTVTAYFIQKGFTVTAVTPGTPAAFFSDAFSKTALDDQVALGRINANNLPVWVSNITYGRVLMFSITSKFSLQDIQAALDFSYEAAKNGVNANLDLKSKQVLDSATIKVAAVGGDDAALISLIRSGDLYQYFQKNADLATLKPLSYQVDNVGDGSAARFTETTSYNLKECAPLPNNPVKAGEVAKLTLKNLSVPLKTIKNGNQIDNCQQIRFGPQVADMYGQVSLDGLSWWDIALDNNIKVGTGTSLALIAPGTLPIAVLPDDLKPTTPLKAGQRVFRDSTGGTFSIVGTVKDQQGADGDPVNTYNVTESYPFTYGLKTVQGNSANCKINLEYNLEKIRDLYQYTP
jgi:Thiol-activated cytolysin/Fibronectin type III domain